MGAPDAVKNAPLVARSTPLIENPAGKQRISSKTPRPMEVRLLNTTIAKIERLEGERVIPLLSP
jgi:hypothetical protein